MLWENNNRLVTMHTSDHFIIRLHSLLLPAREVQGHLLDDENSKSRISNFSCKETKVCMDLLGAAMSRERSVSDVGEVLGLC